MNLVIGSHVSFKKDLQLLGSVREALEYGSNGFMFYTGAPQNTRRMPINDSLTFSGYELMKENDLALENVIVHAPYIINLANRLVEDKFKFAVSFLKDEITRCESLNIKNLVMHPGSHVGVGSEVGINNIIEGLNRVLYADQNVSICLETMSGKGSEVGRSFEELKAIIDGVQLNDKIKVCLDTCHIHDAGYDINDFDKVLDEFDRIIGLDKLACLHINDSKNERYASKDRHENLGKGFIGFDNLISIIYNKRLDGLPKILETPYITVDDESKDRVYAPYKDEIKMIRNKKFESDYIEGIRNLNIK